MAIRTGSSYYQRRLRISFIINMLLDEDVLNFSCCFTILFEKCCISPWLGVLFMCIYIQVLTLHCFFGQCCSSAKLRFRYVAHFALRLPNMLKQILEVRGSHRRSFVRICPSIAFPSSPCPFMIVYLFVVFFCFVAVKNSWDASPVLRTTFWDPGIPIYTFISPLLEERPNVNMLIPKNPGMF